MEFVTVEHAKIAEGSGVVTIMALERVPADIGANGGVARMSDPELFLRIKDAATIPVMRSAALVTS